MGQTTIGWTQTPYREPATGELRYIPGWTFNPWIGCVKVSKECDNCYAMTQNAFYYPHELRWGPYIPDGHPMALEKGGIRVVTSDTYWKQPHKWHKVAQALGAPLKVFCASWADVFEDYPTKAVLDTRARLWTLIEETPMLNWLLLTKRPENIRGMVPLSWLTAPGAFPQNVWLGTSIGEQTPQTEQRYKDLIGMAEASVRFLSCEPLIGPINFCDIHNHNHMCSRLANWIITGGESGPQHRPLQLDHVRQIRDYCRLFAIPHFFKQVGGLHHGDGGRDLDGRTWDEFPIQEMQASKTGYFAV